MAKRYEYEGRRVPKWVLEELEKKERNGKHALESARYWKHAADEQNQLAKDAGSAFKRAAQEGLHKWFLQNFETSDQAANMVRLWEKLRDDIERKLLPDIVAERRPTPLDVREERVHRIMVTLPEVRFEFALHRGLDEFPRAG